MIPDDVLAIAQEGGKFFQFGRRVLQEFRSAPLKVLHGPRILFDEFAIHKKQAKREWYYSKCLTVKLP